MDERQTETLICSVTGSSFLFYPPQFLVLSLCIFFLSISIGFPLLSLCAMQVCLLNPDDKVLDYPSDAEDERDIDAESQQDEREVDERLQSDDLDPDAESASEEDDVDEDEEKEEEEAMVVDDDGRGGKAQQQEERRRRKQQRREARGHRREQHRQQHQQHKAQRIAAREQLMKGLEQRKLQREEKRAFAAQKKIAMMEYYRASFYAESAARTVYEVAIALGKDNNEMLW